MYKRQRRRDPTLSVYTSLKCTIGIIEAVCSVPALHQHTDIVDVMKELNWKAARQLPQQLLSENVKTRWAEPKSRFSAEKA